MPIACELIEGFYSYTHTDIVLKDKDIYAKSPEYNEFYTRYKLHISLHPDELKNYSLVLENALNEALEAKMITGWKVIDVADAHTRSERHQNSPYTIYLDNDLTRKKLNYYLTLCIEIENLLANTRAGKNSSSPVDVPLSTHLIFRQEGLKKGEYIYADSPRAALLKESAMKSPTFIFLQKGLNKIVDKESKEESVADRSTSSCCLPFLRLFCRTSHSSKKPSSDAPKVSLPIAPPDIPVANEFKVVSEEGLVVHTLKI